MSGCAQPSMRRTSSPTSSTLNDGRSPPDANSPTPSDEGEQPDVHDDRHRQVADLGADRIPARRESALMRWRRERRQRLPGEVSS